MTGFGAWQLPASYARKKPRAPGRRNKQPERNFQKRVNTLLEWLINDDIPWTAIGHGIFLTKNREEAQRRGRVMKEMGVKPGWADFLIYHARTLYLLELKSKDGSLSPAQKDVRDMVLGQGGKFAVFKDDLDAVEAQVRAWGIPCNAVRLSPAERASARV